MATSTLTGRFITIEGTDGSGKATQTHLLAAWLESLGHTVTPFEFPRYHEPSAHFVEQYLKGEYGSIKEVGPYRASLFYALDRYEASFKIREALAQGHIVISDRYVGSNMGHQGAKIANAHDRRDYFIWNDQLEFETLGVPRPDLNLVLHMPTEHAQTLLEQAYANGKSRDLHEVNAAYLHRAEETYLELCRIFPDWFTRINCADGQRIRSKTEIQAELQDLVGALLS